MKHVAEIMQILEAFNLTRSYRDHPLHGASQLDLPFEQATAPLGTPRLVLPLVLWPDPVQHVGQLSEVAQAKVAVQAP